MRVPSSRGSGPPGFTLIEVILALTIASVGVCYMYQGVSLCTAAQWRQQFFQKCTDFLNLQMEGVVLKLGAGGGTDAGPVPGPGPAVTYQAQTQNGEYPSLFKITITFTCNDPNVPALSASTTTYYTPVLKVRKEDQNQ